MMSGFELLNRRQSVIKHEPTVNPMALDTKVAASP
jgi:hypothetical protein